MNDTTEPNDRPDQGSDHAPLVRLFSYMLPSGVVPPVGGLGSGFGAFRMELFSAYA